MGQISKTTNPTGLRQIDRKHFLVRVQSNASTGRVFWLEKFNYVAAGISDSVVISCIAHAGSTEEFYELGRVSDFKKKPLSIRSLATDHPLKFRFIFNNIGESLLVAYADGVRAIDESGYLGTSLVDIEPSDLNGVAWKLTLPESPNEFGAKPNVLVERTLFPTAQAAAHNHWFGALVMPEVMRQIAFCIAENPSSLEDSGTWIYTWSDFLAELGLEAPVEDVEDDLIARRDWVESVVEKFAAKGALRHHMDHAISELDGEQK